MSEAEANARVRVYLAEMEKRKKWMQCTIFDTQVFIPDTTEEIGRDIFQTQRFKCEEPDPNLKVLVYPLTLVDSPAKYEFLRVMSYKDSLSGKYGYVPGVIIDNCVVPHTKAKISEALEEAPL